MKSFKETVIKFLREEEGLELSEYAVAGSLIVLGTVAAFQLLGGNISTVIDNIADIIVPPA